MHGRLKLCRNERDRAKSRCMEVEECLKDLKLKHISLLNCICATLNEHTRKSVAYCCQAKVSETKANTSSAKAKLLSLPDVQLVSTRFKELRDAEHKNTDFRAKLEILNREKEHAITELQSSIDSAVNRRPVKVLYIGPFLTYLW